jgi:hypothetical protein
MRTQLSDDVRRERIGQLIEFMRLHNRNFDMREFMSPRGLGERAMTEQLECGTTFCIGGFAAVCARPDEILTYRTIPDVGAEWLGLSHLQEAEMFLRVTREGGGLTTLDEAVEMLSRYAETGEVKWPEMDKGVGFHDELGDRTDAGR